MESGQEKAEHLSPSKKKKKKKEAKHGEEMGVLLSCLTSSKK